MKQKNFTQHFKFIYEYFCGVAQLKNVKATNAGFCELLGISTGKLQGWRTGQWPSAEDLSQLHDIFGFSYRWLVTGEGEPWGQTSIENASTEEASTFCKRLDIALAYRNFSPQVIVRETDFTEETLNELLSGSRLPTFSELEILYTALGIEPAYFFHGNEMQMYEPQTQLERVMLAIGKHSQYTPSHFALQSWFGIDKYEAKAFLADYQKARKNLEEYGLQKCEEGELPTDKALPTAWLEYFSEHTRLSVSWLSCRSYTPALWLDETPIMHNTEKLLELYEENRQLRMRLEQLEKAAGNPAPSDIDRLPTCADGAPQLGDV